MCDTAAKYYDVVAVSRTRLSARVERCHRHYVSFTTTTTTTRAIQQIAFPSLRKIENITRAKYNNYCVRVRRVRVLCMNHVVIIISVFSFSFGVNIVGNYTVIVLLWYVPRDGRS